MDELEAAGMSAALVDCPGVVHIYKTGDLEVVALQGRI